MPILFEKRVCKQAQKRCCLNHRMQLNIYMFQALGNIFHFKIALFVSKQRVLIRRLIHEKNKKKKKVGKLCSSSEFFNSK